MPRKPAAPAKAGKPRGGRPEHRPTPQIRAQVRAFAGFGLPQQQLALLVGMSINTLRKHYAADLEFGEAQATAKVAQSLFNAASKGEAWAVCFWMKARAGWSEKAPAQTVKHEGEVQHQHSGEVVMTAEQRSAVLAAVRARAVDDAAADGAGAAGGQ